MVIKCIYFLKLLLICTLSILVLASVEIAPDHPFQFISTVLVAAIINRSLWRSALKDEAKVQKRETTAYFNATQKMHNTKKKAA